MQKVRTPFHIMVKPRGPICNLAGRGAQSIQFIPILQRKVDENGDLYACDHYVNPGHFLGNLTQTPLGQMADLEAQQQFGEAKRAALPETCLDCDIRFLCQGGCPKNRDDTGLNLLCERYQSFFRHIDGPMRMMVDLLGQNRAPAEIMHQLPVEAQVN